MPHENDRTFAFSYMELRVAVGVLGMALPFVLAIGGWILFDVGIRESVSAYYHTGMGDVFVGTLFAIGFFLLSYRGPDPVDNRLGDVACLSAIGAALFPTDSGCATGCDETIGLLHTVFAFIFFATLISFSLFLFTKTHEDRDPTPRKKLRNIVYKVCGVVMAACIVGIGVHFALSVNDSGPTTLVFWLEAIAVFAFGVSWFTKGEAILADKRGESEDD